MRPLAAVLLLLVFGVSCVHRHFKPEHQDECIDPSMESMSWHFVTGTAVRIDSGQTFLLRDPGGKSFQIDLVGLETGDDGAAARRLLTRLIQGKRLFVYYNPKFGEGDHILGEAQAGRHYRDVNRLLLQAGVVRYKEPPAYSVSDYSDCLYRIAEREAKQARLGLWSKE